MEGLQDRRSEMDDLQQSGLPQLQHLMADMNARMHAFVSWCGMFGC